MQPRSTGLQLLDQFADVIRLVRHRPQVANLAAPLTLCNRDRNRRLVDIQSDEHAILHLVSPPFLRLGAGQSGATLERKMPREMPQAQSTHSAIMGSKTVIDASVPVAKAKVQAA